MTVLDVLLAALTLSSVTSTGLASVNGKTAAGKAGNAAQTGIKETSLTYVPQRCLLDSMTGPCRASMPKYYFNIKTGQCERFVYGGCRGNWNRFDTLSECHQTCTCKTSPETGPCRGHFRRWFYSPADGCCRPFVYGGCGGNSNNYATWTECSNLCGYPTKDSKWWEWGADWWKVNADLNATSGTNQFNRSLSYSRDDFMRDWLLWGLLTGGEGELEMETIATLIAQAHILGFGRSTGAAGAYAWGAGAQGATGSQGMANAWGAGAQGATGVQGGAATWGTGSEGVAGAQGAGGATSWGAGSGNAQSNNAYGNSLAETKAALAYFQRMFGGGESEGGFGGMFGAGGQGYGPAYNIQGSGTFTPLGQVGSIDSMVGLGAGMADTNGRDRYGSAATGGWNQWGAGQFGHGTQVGQGQFQGQSQGQTQGQRQGQFQGQRFDQNQGQSQGQFQGQHFGKNQGQSQGQTLSGNKGFKVSGGEANYHDSWGQSRSQNLGNRRNGWAPHGERVLPFGAGTGQFGTSSSGGGFGQGGAAVEILRLIGQISSGNLKPSDLMGLAQRFGAMEANGGINVDTLAQRMVNSLTGASGQAQLGQLKGIAKSLGALDTSGNIDINLMMSAMAKSLGRGDLWLGGGAGGASGGSGSAAGGGQFGTSQGASGSSHASGGMAVGGGSQRKAYGKK